MHLILALLLAQDDPVRIAREIRTWYRVLDGADHVGCVEERITPREGRFLYYWRLETWDGSGETVEAELDSGFDLLRLTTPGLRFEVDAKLRRIVRTGGTTVEVEEGTRFHVPLTLLQLRQQGLRDGDVAFFDGARALKIVRHADRLTHVELGGASGSVDRYGRAIEWKDGARTIRFAKTKEDAWAGRLVEAGRRDPFRKDLVMRGFGTPTPREIESPSEAFAEIDALGDRAIRTRDRADYERYLKAYARHRGHRELAAKKREVERVFGGAMRRIAAEVDPWLDRIVDHATRDEVADMERGFAKMKEVRALPEFDEAVEAQDAYAEREDLALTLIETSRARLELFARPLRLGATAIAFEEGEESVDVDVRIFGAQVRVRETRPFSRSVAHAVINGVQVRVGDRVGDLSVVEITRYGATLSRPARGRVPELLRELPLRAEK